MRAAIIITLIVVGGGLVAGPLAADYLLHAAHQANLVRLLEKPGVNNVTLQQEEVHVGFAAGCWAVGAALAGAGTFLAVRELRAAPPRARPPEMPALPPDTDR